MKATDRPEGRPAERVFDCSTAGGPVYLHVVEFWHARRLDDRYVDLAAGDCPRCGATAWAWTQRHGRPDDWWRCSTCGSEGTLYQLHHELLAQRRAAA
jgi:hypothetical protein